jgi:hypothetical protein
MMSYFSGLCFSSCMRSGWPFVVHQFHAQLAIGAVLLGVGGVVDQFVFGADVLVDLEKMSGISRRKAREVARAAGQAGKVFIWLSACSMVMLSPLRMTAASWRESAGGDGVDGDVLRRLHLLENLVQRELGERVAPEAMRMMYLRPSMRSSRSSPS